MTNADVHHDGDLIMFQLVRQEEFQVGLFERSSSEPSRIREAKDIAVIVVADVPGPCVKSICNFGQWRGSCQRYMCHGVRDKLLKLVEIGLF